MTPRPTPADPERQCEAALAQLLKALKVLVCSYLERNVRPWPGRWGSGFQAAPSLPGTLAFFFFLKKTNKASNKWLPIPHIQTSTFHKSGCLSALHVAKLAFPFCFLLWAGSSANESPLWREWVLCTPISPDILLPLGGPAGEGAPRPSGLLINAAESAACACPGSR